MLYLNLDLLENVNGYFYPLFYYCFNNCFNNYAYKEIYCSRTLKSVRIDEDGCIIYFDNLNETYRNYQDFWVWKQCIRREYTKNYSYFDGMISSFSIKPFKIDQEHLNYLRSSERIKNYII